MIASTGPAICSRVAVLSRRTPVRIVGWKKWPGRPHGRNVRPPNFRRAPSLTAYATWPSTRRAASCEIKGPISVSGFSGSPISRKATYSCIRSANTAAIDRST